MKKIILLSSTLFFIGCYLIPCNFEQGISEIKSEKEKSFFIGEYVLEKSFNNNFKNKEAKLILNNDGTLDLINFSSKVFDPFNKKEKLISVKNNWKLIYIEKREEYRLSIALRFEINGSQKRIRTSDKFYVKNNKPIILFEIGDPDRCMAVRFVKK